MMPVEMPASRAQIVPHDRCAPFLKDIVNVRVVAHAAGQQDPFPAVGARGLRTLASALVRGSRFARYSARSITMDDFTTARRSLPLISPGSADFIR